MRTLLPAIALLSTFTFALAAPLRAEDAPAASAAQEPAKDLKMYHAAPEGFKRVVIRLPQLPDERDCRLEIMAFRTLMVDGINHHGLGGALAEKTVEGWGYPYWEMTVAKSGMSTLMGGSPEQMALRPVAVAVHGNGFFPLRYNSKLPVVVYAPKDVDVRYRVWKAPAKSEAASVE